VDTNNLLLVLVPIVVVWALALRPLGETALRRWATRYGAPLDERTRPLLRRRIHVGRSIRATGATVGILVSSLPALTGTRGSSFNIPIVQVAWLTAIAVGVLAAELAAGRRPAGSVRRASLEVRQVGDYVDRADIGIAGVALAATGAGIVAALITNAAADRVLAATVLVAVGATVLGFGLRAVPHRPLAGDASVRAADEALRSEGAHHIVGVAAALGFTGAAETWGAMVAVFSAGAAIPFALGHLVGLGIWWALVHDTVWRVRRHAAQPS